MQTATPNRETSTLMMQPESFNDAYQKTYRGDTVSPTSPITANWFDMTPANNTQQANSSMQMAAMQ